MFTTNMVERALWTGLQALVGLGVTWLASVPAWWAAPIALLLSGLKTKVIDVLAARPVRGVWVSEGEKDASAVVPTSEAGP